MKECWGGKGRWPDLWQTCKALGGHYKSALNKAALGLVEGQIVPQHPQGWGGPVHPPLLSSHLYHVELSQTPESAPDRLNTLTELCFQILLDFSGRLSHNDG